MASSMKYLTDKERRAVGRFHDAALERLTNSIIRISIFGSKVRGDYTDASDIDILVIVKERTMDVMDQIADITCDLNIEYDLSIAPVVFSQQEYNMNASMDSPFLKAVNTEGLRL